MGMFFLACFAYGALITCSGQAVQGSIIVHPRVLEAREAIPEKTLVVHDGHSLRLRKASVLAARVLLQDITSEGIVHRYIDGNYYERYLYHDSEKQAALLMKPQANGGYHITGIVNSTHRIEPLLTLERSLSGGTPHKLSRMDLWNPTGKSARRPRSSRRIIYKSEKKEDKLKLPQNFSVETVFISDKSHSERFNTTDEHVDYVMVLMLGASLRFQLLNPPGYIILTSIRRSTEREDKIFLNVSAKEKVAARPTLRKIANHAIFDFEIKDADAVYLATKRAIEPGPNGGNHKGDLLGMAIRGGICDYEKGAVGKDDARTYSGMHVVVHEMGHLLGLHHDGDKDSKGCLLSGGFIMHPYDGGERYFLWSQCSKRAIKDILQLPQSKCLHHVNKPYLAVLPNDTGNVIDGRKYCKEYFRNHEQVSHIEVSGTDNCYFRCEMKSLKKGPKYANIPAPDGTPCDQRNKDKTCYEGFCMKRRQQNISHL